MVASIQVTFLSPVKQCLNITRQSKKLNVFRHVDTVFMAHHTVSAASSETGIASAL